MILESQFKTPEVIARMVQGVWVIYFPAYFNCYPSFLNTLNCRILPYGSKIIVRNHQYWSNPKLGPGIFEIRIITCSCHACTAILYISWDSKIKEAVNQPRYGRVYNCKNSQIIGCHNNQVLMNFFMKEQMNKFTNILIKLLLMVM